MFTIAAFVDALTLEEVGTDRYRANSLSSTHGVVFGGQLLAQSVMAGLAGQEGKTVKTIHTVFARGASPDAPLDIAVERMHSGRSVASSTVTISQGDTLGHPLAGAPQRRRARRDPARRHATRHGPAPTSRAAPSAARESGRSSSSTTSTSATPSWSGPPELDAWVRFVDAPDDPATDQALVAYSTDGFLIGTAMRPHAGVGQAQAHVTLSTGRPQPHPHVPRALPRRRVAPAAAAELVRRDTAAATGRATSSAATGSWPPPSCRTP